MQIAAQNSGVPAYDASAALHDLCQHGVRVLSRLLHNTNALDTAVPTLQALHALASAPIIPAPTAAITPTTAAMSSPQLLLHDGIFPRVADLCKQQGLHVSLAALELLRAMLEAPWPETDAKRCLQLARAHGLQEHLAMVLQSPQTVEQALEHEEQAEVQADSGGGNFAELPHESSIAALPEKITPLRQHRLNVADAVQSRLQL